VQDERTTSTRKNIRFSNELLSKIESKLDGKAFGTWVQETCASAVYTKKEAVHTSTSTVHTDNKKSVHTSTKDGTQQQVKKHAMLKSSYAAKHGLPGEVTKEEHERIMKLSKQGLSGPKISAIISRDKSTINRIIQITRSRLISE
jgi:hypothetical protein